MEFSTDVESSILSKGDNSKLKNNNNSNFENKLSKDNSKPLTLYSKPIIITYDDYYKEELKYEPSLGELEDKYSIEELVYECVLAPTKVFIGKNKLTGEKIAIKQTEKNKMKNIFYEFLYNEMAVSKYMSCVTHAIVSVYDYYETDQKFSLVMEYCDRPNFFEELLENVS